MCPADRSTGRRRMLPDFRYTMNSWPLSVPSCPSNGRRRWSRWAAGVRAGPRADPRAAERA